MSERGRQTEDPDAHALCVTAKDYDDLRLECESLRRAHEHWKSIELSYASAEQLLRGRIAELEARIAAWR